MGADAGIQGHGTGCGDFQAPQNSVEIAVAAVMTHDQCGHATLEGSGRESDLRPFMTAWKKMQRQRRLASDHICSKPQISDSSDIRFICFAVQQSVQSSLCIFFAAQFVQCIFFAT